VLKRTSKLISMLVGFVAGIGKHYATSVSLTLNDVATTTQQLSTAFAAVIAADQAVKAADAQHQAAIAAANALAEGILPQAKAFKAFVLATFGSNPATLADFNLKQRKVAVLTVEERALAAKKGKATREALGTMGAAQKRKAKQQLVANTPAAPAAEVPPTGAQAAPAVTPAAAPAATPVTLPKG